MSVAVPTGRMRRLTQTAKAASAVGASALLSSRADQSLLRATEMLSELRGVAAKAGQLLGYVEGLAPEARRQVFQQRLGALQSNVAASHSATVAEEVESELGKPVSELFAEWEPEPFASASIGQVHRARLPDGTRVAVKVQHPGIVAAVENDLQNAALLQAVVARLGPKALNSDELLLELSTRFREELDYRKEANNIVEFANLHGEDSTIQLPRLVSSHSAQRVLTTALCTGQPLSEARDQAEPFREFYGETLWRFAVRSIIRGGFFNADPHPGNYLFAKDSKVAFLDFGCVQRLPGRRHAQLRRVHEAALDADEAAFSQSVVDWFGTRGGGCERGVIRFVRRIFEPVFQGRYRVDRKFVRGMLFSLQDFRKLMTVRDGSLVPFPSEMLLLNRLQFGLYSVLAQLNVEIDYAEVVAQVLEELPD